MTAANQNKFGVPAECFFFSDTVGNDKIGTEVNNQFEIFSNEFTYDMRLSSIIGCMSTNEDLLRGLTFRLQTTRLKTPEEIELQSIGVRYGANCVTTEVAEDEYVSYMEVTYDDTQINSFFAKTGDNTNVFYGSRRPGDEMKGWSFNDENQLIGLRGTKNDDGITSIGVLMYQPLCADEALGFDVDPQSGDKNYQQGFFEKDEQYADGTYQFATRPMEFENENLIPFVSAPETPEPESDTGISLNDLDSLEDAYDWAMETPNIYIVGASLLVLLILIISCVFFCCRSCCCCCCSKDPQVTKIEPNATPQDELDTIQKAKSQIKVHDVLKEQRSCEDIVEDEDPFPTQRALMSRETEAVMNTPINAAQQAEADAKAEVARERQSLAEQIMYGSVATRSQLSRQASIPLSSHHENNEKGIELTRREDGIFRSTMSPPDTRDSFREQSMQRHNSGMQVNKHRTMHFMDKATLHGSNILSPPAFQEDSYHDTKNIRPVSHNTVAPQNGPMEQSRYGYLAQQPPLTQYEQQRPYDNGNPPQTMQPPRRPTLTNYSTQSVHYTSSVPAQQRNVQNDIYMGQQLAPHQHYQNSADTSAIQDGLASEGTGIGQTGFNSHAPSTYQRKASVTQYIEAQPTQVRTILPSAHIPMPQQLQPQLLRDGSFKSPSRQDPNLLAPAQSSQSHNYSAFNQMTSPAGPSVFQPQTPTPDPMQYSSQVMGSYQREPRSSMVQEQQQSHVSSTMQIRDSQQTQPFSQYQVAASPINSQANPQPPQQSFVLQQTNLQPVNVPSQQQFQQAAPPQNQVPNPQALNATQGSNQIQNHLNDASSIGRASFPETPNANVSVVQPQVDQLTETVKQLQSQLTQVEKTQQENEQRQKALQHETEIAKLKAQIERERTASLEKDHQLAQLRSSSRTSISHINSQLAPVSYQPPSKPQPDPIVVQVNNSGRDERKNVSQQNVNNLSDFKLEPDQPIVKVNDQSLAVKAPQVRTLTQKDIDRQFRDIPELGQASVKSMAEGPSINLKMAPTPGSSQLGPIQGGSTQFTSSVAHYQQEGQPERTTNTTSVIELNSMAEAGPISAPKRHTPSPTYFTK